MKVNTIGDTAYVVTCGGACTVVADVNGTEVTLASLGASGGQASFMAVSDCVEVSDPAAMVLPYIGSDVPLGMGGGITAEQSREMVESALYEFEPVVQSTAAGRDNATFQYIDIDEQHVPQGRLESISLMSRSGGNPPTPSYLALWELGEDGATWSYLGSSMNNPGQTMNRLAVWEFEEDIRLSGRRLRVLAQSARSDVWEAGPDIGGRTTPTPEGDGTRCYRYGVAYAFLPELSISVQQPVPKFVAESRLEQHKTDAVAHVSAAEREEWNSGLASAQRHAADAVAHVTAEERTCWNANTMSEREKNYLAQLVNHTDPPHSMGVLVTEDDLSRHENDILAHVTAEEHAWLGGVRAGSQEVAAPALTIKGSQNNNLLVVRGNQTNVSVTGSQMSFNVPQLSAMSDVPVLYRYDMASGSSEVWLAGAPDATRLAPMGITEAGTHVGAPSLPLRLRGSELSFNGEEINVPDLAELLAHKDELLALLAPPAEG